MSEDNGHAGNPEYVAQMEEREGVLGSFKSIKYQDTVGDLQINTSGNESVVVKDRINWVIGLEYPRDARTDERGHRFILGA